MKLFSMGCTIYSNVMVAGTRYRIHLYTSRLGLLATTLHYGGANTF